MNPEILRRLQDASEEGYRAFMCRLIPGKTDILGVRMPRIRQLAKEILKQDAESFLQRPGKRYYEEVLLWGLVIAQANMPMEKRLKHTVEFLPHIDNWAICDSFCSAFAIQDVEKDALFSFSASYLTAKEEYAVRFAAVMILEHFLDPFRIREALAGLQKVVHPGYYAQMGVAWALSVACIEWPKDVIHILEEEESRSFLRRKTRQKILDSRRVDATTKEKVRELPR